MDPITQQTVLAAAGAAGGGPLYVDDVFSTYLYKGNSSTQTITNGIDLAGKGGLVWTKGRGAYNENHGLVDTARGTNKYLASNNTGAQGTGTQLTSFNGDGYTLGAVNGWEGNWNGRPYASWTFRKAPGFFDVVTWTGSGSDKTISHNLGSVPGCIMVKCTSHDSEWYVYHRSLPTATQNWLRLSNTAAANGPVGQDMWGPPSSTTFKADTYLGHSTVGRTYVAYIFAHDDARFGTDKDESIIKCGIYTGNGGTQEFNLGFEPQWVLIKNASASADWKLFDTMRDKKSLSPNTTGAEDDWNTVFEWGSNGFKISGAYTVLNKANDAYIYMAIRRPHKPPTAATEVFAMDTFGGGPPAFTSGFPVDFVFARNYSSNNNWNWSSRLQSGKELVSNSTNAESSNSWNKFDFQDGWYNDSSTYSTFQSWMFKRAPGFMDVVAYTGTRIAGTAIPHNLGSVPGLMIVKKRGGSAQWYVYHQELGATKRLLLDSDVGENATQWAWNNTEPTATVFTLGDDNAVNYNGAGNNYIAYLFATLPGISKVGSYTGTGSAINVNCGFTAGARFILIKRSNGTGDWYVWDTLRGIVSGNDPYLLFNSQSAQVTNTDYIDPLGTGFTVTASAPAALNASGGTYIFLAIA